jgi:hypothetical protein
MPEQKLATRLIGDVELHWAARLLLKDHHAAFHAARREEI